MMRAMRASIYGSAVGASVKQAMELEVEAYTREKRANLKVDALQWWFERRSTYPRLYKAAMDYLAIQGSSTASERDFSASGRIHTKKRASMKPETLSAVMLLRSWNAFQKRRIGG